ncbi:MAG: D-glycerate dehydrogenase [Deltaproteobacteria bacterium]|nr:D-glycerate dehydrogenase [Deltaproteobacteria bacterium]
MPEVLVSRPLALESGDAAWLALKKIARVHVRTVESKVALTRHPKLKNVAAVITMGTDPVDSKFLAAAPQLAIVANHAVGYNNIDLDAARARGVIVCNTPGVLTNATAELTIGLLFAAARRFGEGVTMIRKSAYRGWHPCLMLGRELAGARLGIVGHGRIGAAVAAKAWALGMDVVHSSPMGGIALDDLLRTSDFVSIHCPLNAKTKGMFGSREFALMKQGSYLINAARGEIVDERALLAALRKNLRGAALDVFHNEPKLNPKLRTHPAVFVLPHLGSATVEARAGMARLAVNAVIEVLSGRPPANRVS